MSHISHCIVWQICDVALTVAQSELVRVCDVTHSYVWRDSSIFVTWLIHMCDMTHSYVWSASSICVTQPIHMCDLAHSYVWHDSFACVTWLIRMCDMTHSYACHDSFIFVTWLIHMCDLAHSDMGWLQWAGSLKSKVSFAKEPCKRDYILQKRPIIWRSLLVVATPYVTWLIHMYYSHVCVYVCQLTYPPVLPYMSPVVPCHICHRYGVATVSRIDEIIGLFCRISSLL